MFWGPLLLVDQNKNTAGYLKHSLKVLCLINESTMCTRHKPLCLDEPVWLWIYLPNFKWNQNWLLHIQKPSIKRMRARVVSYNLTESVLMFLWFLWWQKRSVLPLQLQHESKTVNRGIQKLTLHPSYLLKWQNSKSSEFLNISFTSAPQ